MSYDHQSPSDRADMEPDYPVRFPTDFDTGAHYCPECGEPECDVSDDAWEAGEAMCPKCWAAESAHSPPMVVGGEK